MRKVVLGLALGLSITSMATTAQEAADAVVSNSVNCADFSSSLAAEASKTTPDMVTVVANLVTGCPTITDQIVELAVSLSAVEDHQQLMQSVADIGIMQPADILLAAIAGGGDPATLAEPTAGGNLSIVPASAAVAPPVIGGRNGGAGVAAAASNN